MQKITIADINAYINEVNADITDNRFAVINGILIEIVTYTSINDEFSVLSTYTAETVHNPSYGADLLECSKEYNCLSSMLYSGVSAHDVGNEQFIAKITSML